MEVGAGSMLCMQAEWLVLDKLFIEEY